MYFYKLIIEYDGTEFAGWQKQQNAISVQEVIEQSIFKFSNEEASLIVAGRTDAGVHALGQVAHFSLSRLFTSNVIVGAINFYVRPHKVSIIDCSLVDENFHARFSAKARHYLYRIVNRPTKPILEENRVWWIKEQLDYDLMQIAAKYLLGKHNFTSFRAKYCQASSPIKTLSDIKIVSTENEIKIYVSAPSFLYHMVRNIVGTLRLVGNKKISPEQVRNILELQNRDLAGPTAPAHGLYLIKVDY